LSADLGAGSIEQLWITDIYGFMIAGFLVTMGTLGDRIGRRKLLLIGAAAFGVASMLAAFSTNAEMLIATRTVLGIAGATVLPSTLALVSNMFRDPRQKGFAIAAVFSCFLSGGAFGPVVGGVMLEFFWWGSVFLLGVPVIVLLVATGPLLLPEYRDTEAGRVDLFSVALSLAAILPVVWSLKELARYGLGTVPILATVIGIGFLLLTWVEGDGGLTVLVVGFTIGFFGLGLPGGLGINMIVGSAPPEKAGAASAMSETGQELGLALGFATLGSLGTTVYRNQMADAVPSGIPDAAREGLAGAVAAADQLPAPLGAGLLDSAREAFTAGLNTTAGIGAAVFVALAILAAFALRHVPPTSESQPEQAEGIPAAAPGADHDPKEASVSALD